MARSWPDVQTLLTIATLIVASTAILTAAFVGILGLVTGEVTAIGTRLPYYVVLAGLLFVASVITLTRYGSPAETVVVGSTGIALVGFTFILLDGEGVLFALQEPDMVFGSQLVLYFFAAGLIATGLAYWLVNYWRDIFGDSRRSLARR
ncbi:MAG: hypothetical protein ABEJ57_05985 [Halobacteriaceae archaeon]